MDAYFRERIRASGRLHIRRDAAIGVAVAVVTWLASGRSDPLAKVVAAIEGAIAGVVLVELTAFVWRFVWTVPRQMHLDSARGIKQLLAERDALKAQLDTREGDEKKRTEIVSALERVVTVGRQARQALFNSTDDNVSAEKAEEIFRQFRGLVRETLKGYLPTKLIFVDDIPTVDARDFADMKSDKTRPRKTVLILHIDERLKRVGSVLADM
jgi:hypothetical protein